jgi:hypothetical protein
MGLDTTHDCWHGSYGSFHRFRTALAQAAGLPPLDTMAGFTRSGLPGRSWAEFEHDALVVLLNHEDCDGEIACSDCARLADRLDELLPLLSENWRRAAAEFSVGLRAAAAAGEDVEFR